MFEQKYTSTLGFAGTLVGSFIVSLDAVGLAPSLPVIENALNATTIETYWAGVAYTLGSATCLPLFPAASNIAGRRPITLVALFIFLIGTIVGGSAQNIGALLAGRVLQGIGGGGIIGMMYVVIVDLFDWSVRPKLIGVNGLVWLVGTTVGPVMGGGFSENVSWRWIFWIALPLNAVAFILVSVFLDIPKSNPNKVEPQPRTKDSGKDYRKLQWKDLDYFGAALLVTSMSSFLIAIIWGGVSYEWNSAQTLVPLFLGVAGIGAWGVYEILVPSNPLVPLRLLCERTVSISFWHIVVIGIIQFAVIFYLPIYFQIIKGYSPLISGVGLIPTCFLAGPSTMVAGMIIAKTGRYKMMILVGWILMALGLGLYMLLNVETSVAAWIFISFPAGLSTGIVFAATAVSVQAPVAQEHAATVSGLIGSFRAIGQAVGIACGNAITLNVVKTKLLDSDIASLRENADLIANNIGSARMLSSFAANAEAREELLDAYVSGLRGVWWLLFGLACFCAVSTLLIRDVDLKQNKAVESAQSSQEALNPPSSAGSVGEKSDAKVARESVATAV